MTSRWGAPVEQKREILYLTRGAGKARAGFEFLKSQVGQCGSVAWLLRFAALFKIWSELQPCSKAPAGVVASGEGPGSDNEGFNREGILSPGLVSLSDGAVRRRRAAPAIRGVPSIQSAVGRLSFRSGSLVLG